MKQISDGIFVNHTIDGDALILDCDGTLVDISDSYNACIKYTVGFFLERLLDKKWYDYVTDELIQILRASGGFNNDIDACYAFILIAIASNAKDINDAREFTMNVINKADARGVPTILEILKGYDLTDVMKYLNYPSKDSILARKFDELFYGKELFNKIYGIEVDNSRGFIEYDRLIITPQSLDVFKKVFGSNIAIVSGRSKIATEYTLKEMITSFNLRASVFIEDEERIVFDKSVSKPSPYSLIRSMNIMNVKSAICVGDSMEDLIMARNASKYGYNVSFVGVYENGLDNEKQLSLFKRFEADAIIRNINQLPSLLEMT
ncbi:MAG: hypothetical protein QW416_02810 [Candidatus Nitrosocaldaceae archaeon]